MSTPEEHFKRSLELHIQSWFDFYQNGEKVTQNDWLYIQMWIDTWLLLEEPCEEERPLSPETIIIGDTLVNMRTGNSYPLKKGWRKRQNEYK